MAGDARRLGIYGFGAAAHIVAHGGASPGPIAVLLHAPRRHGGAGFRAPHHRRWAGGSDGTPPEPLDAALIFAPVGALVPTALRATAPGGVVVCGGIHMSNLPSFPYEWLWQERSIRSVANLTRRDAEEFLALVPQAPVRN